MSRIIDGSKKKSKFSNYLLQFIDKFVLLDIGCAGGIDQRFIHIFGDKLEAHGIDSNSLEIEKLNAYNTAKNVNYHDCLLVLPDTFCKDITSSNNSTNVFVFTSSQKAINIITKQNSLTSENNTKLNMYNLNPISNNKYQIKDFLVEKNIKDIDFCKIDVDGHDFSILKNMNIDDMNTLCILIEVDYTGTTRRFGQIDMHLYDKGFACVDIAQRNYAHYTFPTKFVYTIPAQTQEHGRGVWADMLYFKETFLHEKLIINVQKIIKLSILYDVYNMSSWACGVLKMYEDILVGHGVDVNFAIDLLLQDNPVTILNEDVQSNKKLNELFESDFTLFYPN